MGRNVERREPPPSDDGGSRHLVPRYSPDDMLRAGPESVQSKRECVSTKETLPSGLNGVML